MKYCVSARQAKATLRKADEIKFEYRDRKVLMDYIEEYYDKTIILEIPKEVEEEIDWALLGAYSEKVNFYVCLYDLKYIQKCKEYNVKWYWAYPITTFYELQGIVAAGADYLFLGAPLCFSLDKVQRITMTPVRLCPNLAYDAYIPRKDGIRGQWIRPEDIELYEPYVHCMEFVSDALSKEATLLHVYKDNGEWPGNLNLLITNLNYDVDNRAIPEEVGEARITCGQRCMAGGQCRLCETGMKFATTLRKKHLEDKKKKDPNNISI